MALCHAKVCRESKTHIQSQSKPSHRRKTEKEKRFLGGYAWGLVSAWGQGLSKLTFFPLPAKGKWCTDHSVGTQAPGQWVCQGAA